MGRWREGYGLFWLWRRRSFLFSHRFLSEALYGRVEGVKALVEAKADVDKEDECGRTALLLAVKKMENLMPGKRTRYMCQGIALLSVTLRTQYRRILLSPSPPPPSSPPMCWGCIFRPLNRCCLFRPPEVARSSEA